jgi:hypothetical protein
VALLDILLGDRAGSYLLVSCLLVTTLAIIAAIVDIPVRSLREAGLAIPSRSRQILPHRLLYAVGIIGLLLTWLGAASQAYISGATVADSAGANAVLAATNFGFLCAVVIWGMTGPLMRHWGLCLGAFGLGLASFFLLLAGILQLDFRVAEALPGGWQRPVFAGMVGLILISIGACLAAILALVAHVVRGAGVLAREHRLHHESVSFAISAKLVRQGGIAPDESAARISPNQPMNAESLEPLRRDAGD